MGFRCKARIPAHSASRERFLTDGLSLEACVLWNCKSLHVLRDTVALGYFLSAKPAQTIVVELVELHACHVKRYVREEVIARQSLQF